MKTSSWALFNLIHSLSKEEKKYFLRSAIRYRKSGKNFLIKLFKLIEKTTRENYNEKLLTEEIPNPSVRKKELYELILNNLADHGKGIPFLDMLERIRYAAILSYRLMMNETLDMLNQVDKIATEQSQLYIKGTLLQYKIIFLNPNFRNFVSLDWKELSDDFLSNAKSIQQTADIFSHFIKTNTVSQSNLLLRNQKQVSQIKQLVYDKFYSSDVKGLPITHQCYFYFSKFQFNRILTYYKKALECLEYAWAVVCRNLDYFQKRRPIEYLYLYTTYVLALLEAGEINKLSTVMKEYNETVRKRYAKYEYADSKDVMLNLKYQYLISGPAIDSEHVQSAANYFEENKKQMSHENKRELEVMLLIACFSKKDFSSAWGYAHDLMNDNIGKLRQETIEIARVIFWLILWEERELNDLKNQMEKFTRLIRKKGKDGYAFEQMFVNHFKKLMIHPYDHKLIKATFQNLKKEMLMLKKKNDLCTNFYLNQFDFLKWAEDKSKLL